MNFGHLIRAAGARRRAVGGRRSSPCWSPLLLVLARSRGALVRALALALFVLALANPSLTREDREPLTSVAVGRRRQEPEPGVRRPHRADRGGARRARPSGSAAFRASKCASSRPARPTARPTARGCSPRSTSALADVPPDRVAGAIMITDGRVHDVPADAAALGFAAPVHALITGHANERDRRVVLVTAPRFGIVGQSQTITFRVEDQGAPRRHRARSRSAATARRVEQPQRARRRSRHASTCRSRMPARTSSRSRPRRSPAS